MQATKITKQFRYPDISQFPLLDVVRLIRSEHVGPVTFFHLVARYGSPANALKALPELARRGGKKRQPVPCPSTIATQELEAAHTHGATLLPYGHPHYPSLLLHTYDPPPLLYALGNSAMLADPAIIAMVGARNASAGHLAFTKRLAQQCGEAGYIIASGLARGVDSMAHTGSLPTGTIGVTAVGVDQIYPPENAALYARMAEDANGKGCIITEQPIGTQPQRRMFPARNRIIAGMAQAIVVIEASEKSGSLITARMGIDNGREIFAVPGSPLDPRNLGSNQLIKEGAILINSAHDILNELQPGDASSRLSSHHNAPQAGFLEENNDTSYLPEMPAEPLPFSAEEQRSHLLELLSPSPTTIDALAISCNLSAQQVQAMLLELELAGRIERHPGQRISLLVEE